MRPFALLSICAFALVACKESEPGEVKLDIAPYGTVHVFRHKGTQRNAVVMFSGAEGWTGPLSDRARGLSWPDRVVIGIETPAYLNALKPSERNGAACIDYTAALPNLLHTVAAAVHDPVDPAPLVIGAGSGGTIALIAAAQSQPKTISGVVAEDFCPRLTGPIPPCAGPGNVALRTADDGNGQTLAAPTTLQAPFVAIVNPSQCPATDLTAFTKAMPDARTVDPVPSRAADMLISVAVQTGENLAVIPRVSAADLADLPLVEVPGAPGRDDRLAVIMTGDGGWADIDKTIGQNLAARGIGVIGFSTLKYYWKPQTPEQSAEDLERVIRHYTEAWNRKRIVLIGYSFGAGVLPFLIDRLPEDIRHNISLIALLAPPAYADFEISVGGWIGANNNDGPEVGPAMEGLTQPVLCVRSDEEDDSPCPASDKGHIQTLALKGDHHFNGAYAQIADRIFAQSAAR